MSKFAQSATKPNVTTPILSTGKRIATHEDGAGYERDPKSELFLLAATNMVSERTFYESAESRDDRYVDLIHRVVAEDAEWVAKLVPYMRDTMQMRSASLVMAAEYVRAGGPNGREVVKAALKRADEPAEMLAYWHATYGRNEPRAIKKGIADAVLRLYNERNALRYDGNSRLWRFGDVIERVHPKPTEQWQHRLFRHLLNVRHHPGIENEVSLTDDTLKTLAADRALRELDPSVRRGAFGTDLWDAAGWSWERMSGWLPDGMDAQAWEAVIPQMGYMALLRNLRNFDQAGVSDTAAWAVATRLADPVEVAKSRQFPFRFLSAYKELATLRWAPSLEQALDHSLSNVPSLPGKTLVMIDVSGSMFMNRTRKSNVMLWESAGIFGVALGKKAESADVYAYDTSPYELIADGPLLKTVEAMRTIGNGATHTMQMLVHLYSGQDRVVIITDEQAHDAGHYELSRIPLIYTFNVAGYRPGHLPSGTKGRYTFGGLTDQSFAVIPMIEGYQRGVWPHMVDDD